MRERRKHVRTEPRTPGRDFALVASGHDVIRGKVYGSGQPMILCNGLICTTQAWPFWVDYFAQHYTVIAWDYRGHGPYYLPELEAISVQGFAQDAIRVLDHLQMGAAVAVGHSMGVQVAFEMFKQAPDRVAGVVTCCGTFGNPLSVFHPSPRLQDAMKVLIRLLGTQHEWLNRLGQAILSTDLPTRIAFKIGGAIEGLAPRFALEDLFDNYAQVDMRVTLKILESFVDHSAEDILSRLEAPVVVIGGGKDGMTPPDRSRSMADRLRNSSLLVLEHCSHLAHIEESDRVHAFVHERLKAAGVA